MHMGGAILNSQKHGIIVCNPKKRQPERPEDYGALTLLNDFKLLSRIIASSRECLLLFGTEYFVFQFTIQKVKDQDMYNYNIASCSVWV